MPQHARYLREVYQEGGLRHGDSLSAGHLQPQKPLQSGMFNAAWFHVVTSAHHVSAHPRENAVCDAYARCCCRYKGTHMCQEDNERNLLCIAALACSSRVW